MMITFTWWEQSEKALSALSAEFFEESEEGVTFFRNRLVEGTIVLSVLSFIVSAVILALRVGRTDLPVIFHYNAFFGVDLFGAWWQIYILPAVTFLFFVTNVILARTFYVLKERIASHILLFASFFAGIACLIASFAIAFVNS